MTFQKREPNFLLSFLGKICVIRVEKDLEIKGKLLHFQVESKMQHKPFILAVKTNDGNVLVRGNWIAVKVI